MKTDRQKPPSKVQVGAIRYTIINEPLEGDAGETREYFQRIAISTGMGPDAERDTMLHEVLHAIWRQTPFRQHDEEERIIQALAPALLDTLRRNPKLTAYLLER